MDDMDTLLIGELARRAGVPAPTIRYYESIGLLQPPHRTAAGYRRFPESVVDELRFIRKAQALGFSLEALTDILRRSRAGRTPCAQVLDIARQHLAAVDERVRQLQSFRGQLAAELERWDGQTTGLTCDGLCRFIADAAPEVSPAPARHPKPPLRQRSRPGHSASRR